MNRTVFDVSSVSEAGKNEAHNEDCVLTVSVTRDSNGRKDNYALLAVADGVSGNFAGETASRIAVDCVSTVLLQETLTREVVSPKEAVKKAFREAHEEVLRRAAAVRECRGMATTLTVALIENLNCVIGHVGDSSCFLIRSGSAKKLTVDQTIEGILTHAIGGESDPSASFIAIGLHHNDILILCSDGLNRYLDGEAMTRMLHGISRASQSCIKLVNEASRKGGADDISVTMLRVGEQPE